MRLSLIITSAVVALFAVEARAEIAVLANGQTLKLDGHRPEDTEIVLVLRGGGELTLAPSAVRGFVPDEVMDEIGVPDANTDVRELAVSVARKHGVDPELVLAVVSVESAFQVRAVSPKGAQGLMQLMPQTASSLGVGDAFDPAENLDGGTRHLGSLLSLYGGDLVRALAAYNAGQGAVARHGGVPPYRETREYVRKVLERYEASPGVRQREAEAAGAKRAARGRKTVAAAKQRRAAATAAGATVGGSGTTGAGGTTGTRASVVLMGGAGRAGRD